MPLSPENIAALAALANGIIPADDRDAGAASVDAATRLAERLQSSPSASLYAQGLSCAEEIARQKFTSGVQDLNPKQIHELLARLQEQMPAFFKQLRMDVSALYLSDTGVWERIGFPGPSAISGGYDDFDQPQRTKITQLKEDPIMSTRVDPSVQAFLEKPAKMLIGGEWRESAAWIDSIDPARGKAIGKFPAGTEADADLAVKAARKAFNGPWRKTTPYERARLLQKAAALMEKHGDALAQLITLENGKPLWEAKREAAVAVSWTEHYAGWATKLMGDTIPVSMPGQFLNYTVREPLGVVAGITPPNYPLTMPLYKAAPALATGNTIIIKPSEDTSLIAIRLAEIFLEAGFPEGVFNVVTGYGEAAGAALAAHSDVDKITFTGSTDVGR